MTVLAANPETVVRSPTSYTAQLTDVRLPDSCLLDGADSFDEFVVLMGQHIHKGITESDNVKI